MDFSVMTVKWCFWIWDLGGFRVKKGVVSRPLALWARRRGA